MQAAFGGRAATLFFFAGLATTHAADQVLQVTSFAKYPGSSTTAVLAGAIFITPITVNGTVQHRLQWKLTGTDDECGNETESGNVCGIHIHVGKDCADATTIGGHLHSTDIADPWTTVRYASVAGASTELAGQSVETGLTTDDLLKRVVVVHNSVGAGERIACGIATVVPAIPKTERLIVKKWVKYPGSAWTANVSGTVTIEPKTAAVVDTVALSWDLKGTDDACPTGNGNTCGIHIHEGKTCDTAEEIGAHFYDTVAISSDPWTAVRYSSNGGNAVSTDFSTEVAIGLKRASILGRVVIVHSSEGAGERIACGILEEPEVVVAPVTTTSFLQQTAQVAGAHGFAHVSVLLMMLVAMLCRF